MDIKIEKGTREGKNYFENYAIEIFDKYFKQYPFIQSINIFFRGEKHPTKKVKLHARFKGKDVFVEASAKKFDLALDSAVVKLKTQIDKYKTKHYNKAS